MAGDFNKGQIERGKITAAHLTLLVKCWQQRADLVADGLAGDKTIAALDRSIVAGEMPPPPPSQFGDFKEIEILDAATGVVETFKVRVSK